MAQSFAQSFAQASPELKTRFGVSATYTQADDTETILTVLFGETQGRKDSEDFGQVKRRSAEAEFEVSDLGANPVVDETITVASETWNVSEIISIAYGWAKVMLTKADDLDRIRQERVQRGRSLR